MNQSARRMLWMIYSWLVARVGEEGQWDLDVILGIVEEEVVKEHNMDAVVAAGGDLG